MNRAELTGRLTRDPQIRYTQDNLAVANFTIAVDRRFKNGDQESDFIRCIAFGKTAEFIEKYFHQGTKIEVGGRIQTGSYTDKDGRKVYTTDVICEEVGFAEPKRAAAESETAARHEAAADEDGFMNVPDGLEENLPFC